MKRYIFFGLIVFVILGIARAPAGLLTRFVPETADVQILNARGTIWHGQSDLVIGGRSIGTVSWTPHPLSVLTLEPGSDWRLDQPLADVGGYVSYDGSEINLTASGTAEAAAFADWLSIYDISLPGRFDFEEVSLTASPQNRSLSAIDGTLRWSGGRVRYVLSGILDQADLPPMVAYLKQKDATPRVEVFAEGSEVPLLFVEPSIDGFVKVSMTKRFTKLLNRPWPGSDPDHAIVLSVEEKLL